MTAGRIAAALAAAALLAALWRPRRGLGRVPTALGMALALALGAYASGLLPRFPDPKAAVEEVAHAVGPWTYVIVGVGAFLETGAFVGLVVPGGSFVVAAGVIAGQGEIEILPLIGLVWFCGALGDTTSFMIGRRLGRGFLQRHGRGVRLTAERMQRVDHLFEEHGGRTILVGRFIGLVRPLVPFVAGSARMRYGRFLPYSVLGVGVWVALHALLGFFFYRSYDQAARIAGRATLAFALALGTVVAGVIVYRRLRDPAERRRLIRWAERQSRRPLLRPGLGLATALATAGVGLYVFTLYTVILSRDPGTTPADKELLDVSDELKTGALVEVAKLLTDLGSLALVGTFVLATAFVLALRRRPGELGVLIGGFLLVYAAVSLTKAGIDRPRPPEALVATTRSSFPSGHAAYATAYVAVAVIAASILRGAVRETALVGGALLLAAAVGVSRIYLHAHYWSDVAAGWAVGLGIFGACAAVVLVARIGQNGHRPAAPAAAPQDRSAAASER